MDVGPAPRRSRLRSTGWVRSKSIEMLSTETAADNRSTCLRRRAVLKSAELQNAHAPSSSGDQTSPCGEYPRYG